MSQFKGLGIEVKLLKNFNHIREQLTRMGIANNKEKTLTQTVHLFHKKGEYALMHFLEMFVFDGKEANITGVDLIRRNNIVNMLISWGYVEPIIKDIPLAVDYDNHKFFNISRAQVKEENWQLIPKYTIGK